jgi:hypothetical protein
MAEHSQSAASGDERRASPRLPASAVPNLQAKLVAGPDVRLIDVSRRGVLVETPTRLLPGSPVRMRFVVEDATLVLRGAVVRSTVRSVTDTGLLYWTAVAFGEDISVCDPSLWIQPPPPPVSATPHLAIVAHEQGPGPAPPPVEPEPAGTAVFTLFAASGDDLRTLLAANDW